MKNSDFSFDWILEDGFLNVLDLGFQDLVFWIFQQALDLSLVFSWGWIQVGLWILGHKWFL
ncbi:MAG TPA: hypothetical protein VMT76_14055 [Puia sp.]|nr:hypothetical protein [Puia sp.]